jgi:hypothetical protein
MILNFFSPVVVVTLVKKKSYLEYANCLILIIDMMTRNSVNFTVC